MSISQLSDLVHVAIGGFQKPFQDALLAFGKISKY
jgi:hypothetical protein